MAIDIAVQLRHPAWRAALKPYRKTTHRVCEAALKAASRSRRRAEITVVLADDALIQELNLNYRGKNKPTNVLSFPNGEGEHLGDIVLAYETVEREAREQGKKIRHHAMHLLAHGTLHLLGYDHERKKDAALMERMETKILEKLGVGNPYL